VPFEKFLKAVNSWQRYEQRFAAYHIFWLTLYITIKQVSKFVSQTITMCGNSIELVRCKKWCEKL